jgi:hypothetical protein
MIDLTRYEYCRLVERLLIIDEFNDETRNHNRAVCELNEAINGPTMEPEEKECPLQPQPGRPTESDGDDRGFVQYLCGGVWGWGHWSSVAPQNWEWCHTPRWSKKSTKLIKDIDQCSHMINGKIIYHVPKDLVDNIKEYLTKTE